MQLESIEIHLKKNSSFSLNAVNAGLKVDTIGKLQKLFHLLKQR